MKFFRLSDLVGETIKSVHYSYENRNKYDLQEFHAYIKLSCGIIVEIPVFDDENFIELSDENIQFFNNSFENGSEIIKPTQEKIYGQRIGDIYFCYYDGEIADDNPGILKLSNGYYITERNYGPPGISGIDLLILNEAEFNKRKELFKLSVKSYNNEIKKSD